MTQCIVCSTLGVKEDYNNNFFKIECPRCGTFQINQETYEDLPSLLGENIMHRALLSFKIRRSQINNSLPKWTYQLCEKVIEESSLPSIFEQVSYTLEWIGNNSTHGGDSVNLHQTQIAGYVGALSNDNAYYCIKSLEDSGLIEFRGVMGGDLVGRATITLRGWAEFENITKGNSNSNKAFMAMKFGDTTLDNVVKDTFKPAVLQTGFVLFKLDDRPQAGLIDIRMRQEIKASKFMIADLTHANLGAYWEAGFAEGIGKQVIYTCEKEAFSTAKTHFDVNHHLTIIWDKENLPQAAEDLKAAIRYTFPEAIQNDKLP